MVLVYDWRPVLEAGWWRLGIGPLSSRAGHNGTMAGLRSLGSRAVRGRALCGDNGMANLEAAATPASAAHHYQHSGKLAEVTQRKNICNLQENCDYNSVIIHINWNFF